MAAVFNDGNAESRSSDYDLAYNIIPVLNRNGIPTIVISNIANKRGNIDNFDEEEMNRRRSMTGDEYWNMIRKIWMHRWDNKKTDLFTEEFRNIQFHSKVGYLQRADTEGKYINIFQGERLTAANPTKYEHTLWLFGACLIYGAYVEDQNTIGSLLRKKVDASYYIRNMGNSWMKQNMSVRDAQFKDRDVVVVHAFDDEIYHLADLKVFELTEVYQQCPNLMDHVFDLLNHVDEYLTGMLAEKLYEIILDNSFLFSETETKGNLVKYGVERSKSELPKQLAAWLHTAKKYRGGDGQRTGAIVMNCNPFSLGHRYLIEKACIDVDKLLVFVVEEDKSFFKFQDRLEMVKLGVQDLSKVAVIPSGKYIISAETLPGYFQKEENPEVVFDATTDLSIFSEVIAKELNIKVRFAGEEPIDSYTRQYNLAMKKLLPEYGIEFVEISRKKFAGEVISASRIRKLMERGDYVQVKEMVMPEIYDYLKERYFTTV